MAWRQQHCLEVRRLEDAEIFFLLFKPSRMDGIRNEHNRRTAKVERFGDKIYSRLINGVKEDVKMVGVTEAEASDRMTWRQMISCGDPLKGADKRERGRGRS